MFSLSLNKELRAKGQEGKRARGSRACCQLVGMEGGKIKGQKGKGAKGLNDLRLRLTYD